MNDRADDLALLRTSLLRGLGRKLGPEDGEEAFERHILLAIRFHKAAGLNQRHPGQRKEAAGWREYFADHFPKRQDYRADDAKVLWDDWRCGLVKWETPKARVPVTHGQPHLHWYREPSGSLCINLESMWADFTASVDHFIAMLKRHEDRRDEALRRWRERSWVVRALDIPVPAPATFTYPTSVGYSATAIAPDQFRPPTKRT